MKIAVVTPYFPIGAEPYRGHSAYQTLRLLKNKADVEVFCPVARYPSAKWLWPRGYRYHRADLDYRPAEVKATYFEYPVLPRVSRPFNGLVCAHYVMPYLAALRPDVILNYWVYPEGFAATRVGRKLGVPSIVGCIGSDLLVPGDPISYRLVQRTLRNADAVLTVSNPMRMRAIELGLPTAKVTTVPNGCDLSIFRPLDQRDCRRKLGVDAASRLMLYVGWISPTKGLGEMVDAMVSLAGRHPDLRAVLIGEGFYRPAMEERAAAAGIADRLLFLGRMPSEQIAAWLSAADIFCFPSYSEGCPNAIVEAVAAGCPIVASNAGGIPDLVNESCGILVPPRDSVRLAAALEQALAASWDRPHISAHFGRSWEAAAEETYQLCCRVLATRPMAA